MQSPKLVALKHPLSSPDLTVMLVAIVLSAAVMARAQAPAGPNRPPQVPAEYVVTPFGYFHPSCVVHLAADEELVDGGLEIRKADGTGYTVPACEYPHYTARGEMFPANSNIKPPTIQHSWIVDGSATTNTSFGEISATWNVPSAPLSYDGQTIYFFPGLQDDQTDTTILQPVLGWNSDFKRAWGIASWNCCPKGTTDESSPVRVNTGDLISGTVASTCGAGTLSCPTWNITTQDQSTGGSTSLKGTPSEGQTFNWAFGGVLEVYSVVQCSDYPPNNYITFTPTLFDNNFNVISNPWGVDSWFVGLTPQCDYAAQITSDQITLTFGDFTLTVSTTGQGEVYDNLDSIACPGYCSATYVADTQVTLIAYAAPGWVFAGWSGGGCSGTGSCTVTMTQNQTVSASFVPLYTLTVSTSGNGSVQSADGFINCPGVCSYPYPANTPVTLNANPALGWGLNSWSGACTGNNPSCTVVMSTNESVQATFTQSSYTLTASISGQGTITSTDGFIHCPGTCTHTYLSLTEVTLNASPAQGWILSGWTGACMGTGACNVTLTQNQSVTGIFIQPGPGQGFQLTPIMPCRLVDTRQSQPIAGGTSTSFTVPQLGGCKIPVNAVAYSLNVTAVPHGQLGYLTIWPTGEAQPYVSTLNSPDGRIKANAAIVPAGANGAVSVYVTDTSDVILDIDGYFTTTGQNVVQFYPLPPCRVVDTRQGANQPQGLGPPSFGNMETRELPVRTNSPCLQTLTIAPAAYSFNVTVVPNPSGQSLNYLSIWPSNDPQPYVSTLNNPTATVVANAAIVQADPTNGDVSVFTYNSTDVIIDVNGYFAAPESGGNSLYSVAPCRVFDTRQIGNGQPFSGSLSPPVNVAGSQCAPPATAAAYVLNATAIPSPTLGFLTLWADQTPQQSPPDVSILNAYDGFITSNMAIVPNIDGSTDAYAQGTTQLILDISGYFAP